MRSAKTVQPRWNRRTVSRAAIGVAVAVAVGMVAAPSGASTSIGRQVGAATRSSQAAAPQIAIAVLQAPLTLDPAKNGNTNDDQVYEDLAYAPLIMLNPNGSFGPGLATSWKYTNSTLKRFVLTLRPGVRFSDGKPLTAAAVVASIKHEMTANGPVAIYVKNIASAQATGPLTVVLNLTQSNPEIALLLTQRFLIGDIIGPSAAANPQTMGTTTDGAGPYEIDPSATIAGSTYTYVPNPYYYNKSAIHFSRFTVRVIGNPQTALNALEDGQVAYVDGTVSSAASASSHGLKVYSTLASWYGIFLFDRNGALVPALKSTLVRQALNYATDRTAIMNAVFGTYGQANDEVSVPGYEGEGYDPAYKNHYTYNIAKAKQLLAEAGYPHGFSMTIGATNLGYGIEVAQAIASEWSQIGVTVKITDYTSILDMVGPWLGKKLPGVAWYWDAQPMFIEAGQLLAQNAGTFNPFVTSNPVLMSLIAKAYATTSPKALGTAWNAVEREVVDLGWEVPVGAGSTLYFASSSLKGVALSPTSFAPDPILWSE